MKKIPLSQLKKLIIDSEREIMKDDPSFSFRDINKRINVLKKEFKGKNERSLIRGLYEIGFDYKDGMEYVCRLLIDYKK